MDHVINAIEPFLDAEVDEMREEWKSEKYKKYSDCPSYKSVKALVDAINCLRKYIGWESLTIKFLIEH